MRLKIRNLITCVKSDYLFVELQGTNSKNYLMEGHFDNIYYSREIIKYFSFFISQVNDTFLFYT